MDALAPLDLDGRYDAGHEVFRPPENLDATIWRYLDFTKLVSLLDTGRLFFAATSSFDDPFEGSYPIPSLVARARFFERNFDDPEPPHGFLTMTRNLRRFVYASCWNLSEHESAALWGLYAPLLGGVAIRSTFRRLTEAITSPEAAGQGTRENVFVGTVRYTDYEDGLIPEENLLFPFVHKRQSFEFESELRALIVRFLMPTGLDEGSNAVDYEEAAPIGCAVAVDLTRLIEAIHISPAAPAWFARLVASVAARYRCEAPVRQSGLSAEPVF
jgi:hypothetical protein